MGSRTIEFYDDGRTWRNTVSNDSVTHSARPDKIAFSRVSQQDSIAYTPSNDKIHYARGTVLERVQRRSAFKKVFVAPPPPPPTDPHFSNVVALLHMDGTDGSTAITDEIGNAVSVFGNAHIEVDQSKFGGSSLALDGSGDYLRVDGALALFTALNELYTIEWWAYQTGSGSAPFMLGINRKSDGRNILLVGPSNVYRDEVITNYAAAGPLNQWVHWCAMYDGATIVVTADGVQKASVAGSHGTAFADCVMGIGVEFDSANGGSPGNYFPGYIDEVRVTRGVVRYSVPFTPPDAPFPNL